jgi:putative ATPase
MAEGGDTLFSSAPPPGPAPGAASEPLAARMRPRSLDEFAGQEHIVGPGRLLRRAIQKDQLSSIILSGPPGTGKTTLARVIANTTSSRFVTLNAVLAGVADIRVAIDEAKKHRELYDRRTILFVDEVHRWNKAQQDALLPWVENGTIILIGATTENPFFEVNRALVSRSRVFQLRALDSKDLRAVAQAALRDAERGYGRWGVAFADGALEHLVETADGDARSLLNALELAVETSAETWPPAEGAAISVSMEAAEESIQRRAVLYDKDGDYHYDAASAFIKSLRGSDPDAALYWLARMIYAGEDPRFAFRRMLISACEDVGQADPNAVSVVLSCAQAFERIGLPEGQFHLAHAALYLATAPKSNSALGFFDAMASVESEAAEVPNHLKDASRDAKGFGHGEGYLYPHAYRDHWVAQQYLPDSLRGRVFYQPGALGLEGERREAVLERREAQVAASYRGAAELDEAGGSAGGSEGSDSSSWSKAGDARREWRSRAESSAPARLSLVRRALFDLASPSRSDRVLVLDSREGYLVWEALRRCPEGTVAAAARSEAEASFISQYATTLPEIERPLAAALPLESLSVTALEKAFGFASFDLTVGRDILAIPNAAAADGIAPGQGARGAEEILASIAAALPGSRLALAQVLPREGGRLSSVFAEALEEGLGVRSAKAFADFEEDFYSGLGASGLGPSGDQLIEAVSRSGLDMRAEIRRESYPRRLGRQELDAWLSPGSAYGSALASRFSAEDASRIVSLISREGERGSRPWPLAVLYAIARPLR